MAGHERPAHGNVRRPRVVRGPAPGVPLGRRGGRRRAPRRGPWVLLALVLLSCAVVAVIFLRGGEGQAETAKVATVGRPTTAQAPELPRDLARVHALGELDERLEGISRAHAGVHGAVVFDPSLRRERLAQRRPALRGRETQQALRPAHPRDTTARTLWPKRLVFRQAPRSGCCTVAAHQQCWKG